METSADMKPWQDVIEAEDAKLLLKELMETHGNDVWNYAFSLCRNADQADDITQDVFLKAYRNLAAFRGDSSVKTWLLTITRNTVFDLRRSAAWRHMLLTDIIHIRGSHCSAETEALERFVVDDIWRSVLSLPTKYREVLILFAHHQLSMKEIAELLRVSEGTVKSRLHHARAKMIKQKGREEGGQ